jgi:signal transduction histidine kinase
MKPPRFLSRPIISSLGRQILKLSLLVSIAPLLIFFGFVYVRTDQLLGANVRSSLIVTSRLAGQSIFREMDVARAELLRAAASSEIGDTEIAPPARLSSSEIFRRILLFDSRGMYISDTGSRPVPVPGADRLAEIKRGEVVASDPYFDSGAGYITICLYAPVMNAERTQVVAILAGAIRPDVLWKPVRARHSGVGGYLFALDRDGRVVASSSSEFAVSSTPFPPVIWPEIDQMSGTFEAEIKSAGHVVCAHYRLLLEPSFHANDLIVVYARNRETIYAPLDELTFQLAMIVILAICSVTLFSIHVTRFVVEPVGTLTLAMRRVAGGDLECRVPVRSHDEIGSMSASFNQMVDDLRTSKAEIQSASVALARAERDANLGRMAAAVAHEINNPLAVMKARMGMLGESVKVDPSAMEDIIVVSSQIDRIAETVGNLLRFSRHRDAAGISVPLRDILNGVTDLFGRIFQKEGIVLSACLPDRLPTVAGDAGQIQEVFVNVLENARQALARGHRLDLTAAIFEDRVEISFRDDGPGLGEAPERVFEPFYTTKTKGTGLGLTISRRICEAYGGELRAENVPATDGGGAVFRVILPRDDADERKDIAP